MLMLLSFCVYYSYISPTLQKVLRLNYQGWGRFSAEFLKELKGVDTETGEVFSIINALRKTDDNLMQLLRSPLSFDHCY